MLDNLKIKGNSDIPEVLLDAETGILTLKGVSMPENVNEIYTPIMNWVAEYFKNPCPTTQIEFSLSYLNSASTKKISDILSYINDKYIEGNPVIINWYCEEEDANDNKIKDLAELVTFPFNFIKNK